MPAARRFEPLVLASVALICGCQFSIRGATASPDGTTTPPAIGQDGFGAADLASHADMMVAGPMRDLSTPLPDKVGDACSGQCASGLTCMSWVAAGYCSKVCSGEADCPNGSSCVDIGTNGPQYCLVDADAGCPRSDVRCIDCGAKVCGPSSFCDVC